MSEGLQSMGDERDRDLRSTERRARFETLSSDQRRALGILVDLLAEATGSLPTRGEWTSEEMPERAELDLTSRVLLLNGGMGSGRTTVVRTLQGALEEPEAILGSATKSDLTGNALVEAGDVLRKTREGVEGIKNKVIVLEPLRLPSIPREVSILTALLARVETTLRSHVESQGAAGLPNTKRVVDELRELQQDVALAGNESLRRRLDQLSADSDALERLHRERSQLNLRQRLSGTLRQVARDGFGRLDPAMFVLVIDDTDATPGPIPDLLEQLRMVEVPELAVVIVGDIGILEAVMKLHLASRFRTPSGVALDPERAGISESDMVAITSRLARSSIREYLPYHQRIDVTSHIAHVKPVGIRPADDADRVPLIGEERERRDGDKGHRATDQLVKSVKSLKEDYNRVVSQVLAMTQETPVPGQLRLRQIEVGLGFSAEGELGFIAKAKAGVEATVSLTFELEGSSDRG